MSERFVRYPTDSIVPDDHEYPEIAYKDAVTITVDGFDLLVAFENIKGPVVEIAGPTPMGYKIIDDVLPSAPIITNTEASSTENLRTTMLADGAKMPFKDQSVGVVLASCIPITDSEFKDSAEMKIAIQKAIVEYSTYSTMHKKQRLNLRISIIEESIRILENGGLLILQGARNGDSQVSQQLGLTLVKTIALNNGYEDNQGSYEPTFDFIFMK